MTTTAQKIQRQVYAAAITLSLGFMANPAIAGHFGSKTPSDYYAAKVYEEFGEHYFFEFEGLLYSIRADTLETEPMAFIAQVNQSEDSLEGFGNQIATGTLALSKQNRDYYWSLAGVCAAAH